MNIAFVSSVSSILIVIALITFFVYRSSEAYRFSFGHIKEKNKTIAKSQKLNETLTNEQKDAAIEAFSVILKRIFYVYGSDCEKCSANVKNSWFLSQDQFDYAQNYFKCFYTEVWDLDDFEGTFEIHNKAYEKMNASLQS